MTDPALQPLDIAPYALRAGTLFTAKSYFMDRAVPACGEYVLPPKEVAGGQLRWGLGPVRRARAQADPNRLRRLRNKIVARRRETRAIEGAVVFDFRVHSPQNWAHFLNYHLPFFFQACANFELSWSDALMVLPANTPGYITAVAALFGIETLCSDDVITGQGLVFELPHWTLLRCVRHLWVRNPQVVARLDEIVAAAPATPAQVFLARRDTRALINASEAEHWLGACGFETVYPEDLSVAGQLALFARATRIVAIHGAGLAPLLYRPVAAPPLGLLEILPCGHMTDVYRVMSQQIGADWVGVQGRLKPGYVADAYRFDRPYTAHSLDNFELDLEALGLGFDRLGWRA